MRRGGPHHTLCSVDSLTDQRDCTAGFGWLLITGRGYCKAGPIAQTSEVTSCQATRGNTDCSAPLAGSSTHRSGCTAGFGGPLATGRGCRKAGSITQASEAVSFQATPGNTDRSAYLVGGTTSYPDQ